jgi:hypothetical protein
MLDYCSMTMENKGIVIEFCDTGFCSIPGRYTFSMFSSRIGYGDKSFLRECANWHGHLVPDMEISWY